MMFEFTEDKKGLRPKYIGTIKNNGIRRTLMILMIFPLISATIFLNIFAFIGFVIMTFWKLILFGTFKIFADMFQAKTWEVWHKPRQVHDDSK
ncbi:hypothetical protein [Shewanella xiamenensis]|uniref:hypothetical protein n=1 Tax=Shewanella xiamenensis TaxID=332186 RepID=UPI0021BFFC1D|nr:hypothetical protein [Shewanella xiamenensis]MCT8866267.1 hypothetical protein [Shewanella xiamenensis]